ncbi:hypothetical protein AB0465_04880 [Streptomyces griseoviridis]|uniref:hypothetical protein n=1 Tax=Streptomyces griseoviridis TaxID=45398 RepID=UPI003450A5C1
MSEYRPNRSERGAGHGNSAVVFSRFSCRVTGEPGGIQHLGPGLGVGVEVFGVGRLVGPRTLPLQVEERRGAR